MPRFGFLKDDDDGSSSSKSSLFSRKKDRQDVNPYAQQGQKGDPYGAPMTSLQKTQAEMGLGVRGGRPGLPSGPGPRGAGPAPRAAPNAPPPAYGSQPPAGAPPSSGPNGGFSAGGYGAAAGYGSNRYDNGNGNGNNGMGLGRPPSYRSTADSDAGGGDGGGGYGSSTRLSGRRGGYGGMGGGREDNNNDPNRQALFGSAPEKYAQQKSAPPEAQTAAAAAGGAGGYGGGGPSPMGGADGYGEARELTEEEKEDADVKRMNEETRYLRNETDQSLDRSLMIANQSIETARATMARMHHQRDRLFNAEANLDQAANHNKIAEHRTAELKHYNRSMFAVKVNNPFTSKQRAAEQAQAALDEHRAERQQREDTRRVAYLSNRDAEENFTQLDKKIDSSRRLGQNKSGMSGKFNLEDDDEEDIEKERQIDSKIDQLSGAVGTLNFTARAMGDFVADDIRHLDRITDKVREIHTALPFPFFFSFLFFLLLFCFSSSNPLIMNAERCCGRWCPRQQIQTGADREEGIDVAQLPCLRAGLGAGFIIVLRYPNGGFLYCLSGILKQQNIHCSE